VKTLLGLGCLAVLALAAPARAAPAGGNRLAPETVVATVGGDPIPAREVQRLVQKTARGQEISAAARPFVEAQTLAEIVAHRLVLSYAKRAGDLPAVAEIEAALSRFKGTLSAQGKTLERFLQTESLTEADLRRQLVWRLVWDKYLPKYATDERMQAHFAAHRAELDGSELLVSHVLFCPPAGSGPQAIGELVRRAAAVREEIVGGQTTFAEAARRHSSAPSARTGGQLGWIARRGAMDEAFSRAAFALSPGQISPPVQTRFGVHLIRCEQLRPGTKTWTEARPQIEEALSRELLDKLADAERKRTKIEFTGRMAHYAPESGEIVLPGP
jgi:parvulin-like peptidyl-prolyl isomerase